MLQVTLTPTLNPILKPTLSPADEGEHGSPSAELTIQQATTLAWEGGTTFLPAVKGDIDIPAFNSPGTVDVDGIPFRTLNFTDNQKFEITPSPVDAYRDNNTFRMFFRVFGLSTGNLGVANVANGGWGGASSSGGQWSLFTQINGNLIFRVRSDVDTANSVATLVALGRDDGDILRVEITLTREGITPAIRLTNVTKNIEVTSNNIYPTYFDPEEETGTLLLGMSGAGAGTFQLHVGPMILMNRLMTEAERLDDLEPRLYQNLTGPNLASKVVAAWDMQEVSGPLLPSIGDIEIPAFNEPGYALGGGPTGGLNARTFDRASAQYFEHPDNELFRAPLTGVKIFRWWAYEEENSEQSPMLFKGLDNVINSPGSEWASALAVASGTSLPYIAVRRADNSTRVFTQYTTLIPPQVWKRYEVEMNADTNIITIRRGAEAPFSTVIPGGFFRSTNPFRIGRAISNYRNGRMALLAIFNNQLTDGERLLDQTPNLAQDI